MILSFTPISNHFQQSKHAIKARDSRLALVDVAVEVLTCHRGDYILRQREDTESEHVSEEDTENPVRDEDFEVFYDINTSEEETLSPKSTTFFINEDQEHFEAPKDKKRKRDRRCGKGVVEEGEVQEETSPEPTKAVKVTRTQQRKGVESSSFASEHSTAAAQGTKGAAKAPSLADVPPTNAPPTSMVSSAPTPTLEVQATTETEA
nr:hypothetical protein CFP56_48584 [Quercus suber]